MPPLRIELAQVSPCTGCGNCCRHIGLPPFEVPNPDLGPQLLAPTVGGCFTCAQDGDMKTFAAMPADLRAAHAQLLRGLKKDPTGTPCAWLDQETGECAHYEHRPAVCRVFVVGSEPCMALKFRPGTKCVWQDNTEPDVWRNPRSMQRYAWKTKPLPRWWRVRRWLKWNVGEVRWERWMSDGDVRPKSGVAVFVRFLPRYDVELRFWSVTFRRRVWLTHGTDPRND